MFYIMLFIAGIMASIHLYSFRNFLNLFIIDGDSPPETQPAPAAASPPETWHETEKRERAALESEAYYILTMQGHTMPGIVKYTSNKELIQIIHAAKYANYKNGRRTK